MTISTTDIVQLCINTIHTLAMASGSPVGR